MQVRQAFGGPPQFGVAPERSQTVWQANCRPVVRLYLPSRRLSDHPEHLAALAGRDGHRKGGVDVGHADVEGHADGAGVGGGAMVTAGVSPVGPPPAFKTITPLWNSRMTGSRSRTIPA